MSRHSPIKLPPSRIDVAIAKTSAKAARPAGENTLRVLTWLADERVLLSVAGLLWLGLHVWPSRPRVRQEANLMFLSVSLAGVIPHLLKFVVARERPDRAIVRRPRHGIPRSGNAWDSFPSGHAVHLGAVVVPLTRITPRRFWPLLWSGLFGLAATRILLLAHYFSDVVAGLGIGAALEMGVRRAVGSPRRDRD